MKKHIVIGSRGSDLALWQAHHVQDSLKNIGVSTEIKIITTQGDAIQHLSFDKMEGKGFFTKEIEEQLLSGTIDLAVHSHKDLETTSPNGLAITAVSEREDPSELLLIRKDRSDLSKSWNLPDNAIVGTSSARRKSQLLFFKPDVEIKDLRGNVPTRINKLREGQYDAIMLAKAGVSRLQLDLSDLDVIVLDPREFVPAPAQGVLGLQTRSSDNATNEIVKQLNDQDTAERIGLEREVLKTFNGGCQLPLGVYCKKDGTEFQIWASMAEAWDQPIHRAYLSVESLKGKAQVIVDELKKNESLANSSSQKN